MSACGARGQCPVSGSRQNATPDPQRTFACQLNLLEWLIRLSCWRQAWPTTDSDEQRAVNEREALAALADHVGVGCVFDLLWPMPLDCASTQSHRQSDPFVVVSDFDRHGDVRMRCRTDDGTSLDPGPIPRRGGARTISGGARRNLRLCEEGHFRPNGRSRISAALALLLGDLHHSGRPSNYPAHRTV